ncbi:unnamed protein product [Rhodiola kirilowii]
MRAEAFKEIQVLGVQGRRGVLGTWRMMEMTFLDPRRNIDFQLMITVMYNRCGQLKQERVYRWLHTNECGMRMVAYTSSSETNLSFKVPSRSSPMSTPMPSF